MQVKYLLGKLYLISNHSKTKENTMFTKKEIDKIKIKTEINKEESRNRKLTIALRQSEYELLEEIATKTDESKTEIVVFGLTKIKEYYNLYRK